MRYGIKVALALTLALFGSTGWGQDVFTKYGPQPGIQKSTGLDYHNTAAVSADVIGLWSGCTGTNFLRGDGTCTVPAGTGVSSVTVPAPLTATTCTGGACAITWTAAQTANRVLATPDATTGTVSLRALVTGDIPPINLGSTANGGVSSATILLGTNGGTSNGFFSITGPATSLKTFTFPNASATVLTNNALVTVAQGGTGVGTLTGLLKGNGTSAFTAAASSDVIALWTGTCSSTTFLRGDGACASAGGGAVGGSSGQMQYNNAGVFGGDAGLTTNGTGVITLTASAIPTQIFKATTGGVDQKNSSCYYNFTVLQFNCTFLNDALSAEKIFLSATRGTGTAVTGVTLGNPTDLPAITINGTPTFTTGFMTLTGTTNGFSMIDTNATTTNRAWSTGNFSAIWHLRPCNDNVTTCGADAIAIARSANVVTSASFGAPVGTAATFIEGRRTIWGRWTISAGCAVVAGSGTFGFSGAFSSGAGNCTLNFSPSFNTAPVCTATAENIGNPAISLSAPSTSAVVVSMLNAGAATNGNFAVSCTGT